MTRQYAKEQTGVLSKHKVKDFRVRVHRLKSRLLHLLPVHLYISISSSANRNNNDDDDDEDEDIDDDKGSTYLMVVLSTT